MTGRALLIVDVQNDFSEGGSLPVTGGGAVARAVSGYLAARRALYRLTIATRDWHVDPGAHFSDAPDYRESWPPHCVAESRGSEFHPAFDVGHVDVIVSKGESSAAYSGFEGHSDGQTLDELLASHGIDEVDVCGLATDYCVRATALDAAARGYKVRVLTSLCAGVLAETSAAALVELASAGVDVTER